VNNSARSVFHDHQHVKQPESRARDDAEVTGNDGRRVILQKGGPALVVARVATFRSAVLSKSTGLLGAIMAILLALVAAGCGPDHSSGPAAPQALAQALWVAAAYGNNGDPGAVAEFSRSQFVPGITTPVPALVNTSTALDFSAGLAFDHSKNLWVTNALPSGSQSITEFTFDQLKALGTTPAPTPNLTVTCTCFGDQQADVFDKHGNLWVSDIEFNKIFEFTAAQITGSGVVPLTPNVTITSAGNLAEAWGLTIDKSGNLWVSNAGGNVIEFTPAQLATGGAQVPNVIISNDGSGSIDGDDALAFDRNGNLWVANGGNSTVVKFSTSQLTATGSPTPVVTLSSTLLSDGSDSIDVPIGVAVDSAGNLAVSSFDNVHTFGSISGFTPSQLTTGSPVPKVFIKSNGAINGPEQIVFGPNLE
jgi:sugar lactone lactonase YvrE